MAARKRVPYVELITALCFVLCSACGAAHDAHDEPQQGPASAQSSRVRIGYQRSGAPFLLKTHAEALEQQLAAAGAKPEWIEFQSGPPILEALRANAIDIGYVGETPPIFGQAGGVPFVYVASEPAAPEAEAILVPKDSPLRTLADLKGKRLAANRGSNVHYLVVKALQSVNLSLQDITFVALAPSDARTAFDAGQLDAWAIWDPYLSAAELAGARVLHDGRGLVDNRFFYLARRTFAEKQPAQLRCVLAALRDVGHWSSEHREQSARVLSESTGIAYEALLKSESRHVYALEAITPEVLAKQQAIADAFHTLGVIPQAIRTEQASSTVSAL